MHQQIVEPLPCNDILAIRRYRFLDWIHLMAIELKPRRFSTICLILGCTLNLSVNIIFEINSRNQENSHFKLNSKNLNVHDQALKIAFQGFGYSLLFASKIFWHLWRAVLEQYENYFVLSGSIN